MLAQVHVREKHDHPSNGSPCGVVRRLSTCIPPWDSCGLNTDHTDLCVGAGVLLRSRLQEAEVGTATTLASLYIVRGSDSHPLSLHDRNHTSQICEALGSLAAS